MNKDRKAAKPAKGPKADDANAPFFVLGCVRSGTTMLRDVLRLHPNLAAPEETHFFRWAEPFGSEQFNRTLMGNPVLKRHRGIDGIGEEEFAAMLKASTSRADLCQRYMGLFIQRRKPDAGRWFDKTPQNVYGATMIAMSIPRTRFVHIVRNPVNVVSSLRIGKVMKVESLVAAINYWREATDTMSVMKRAFPGRVHEFRYEDFVRDTPTHLKQLLEFLGEPYEPAWFQDFRIAESDHSDQGVLSDAEVQKVLKLTAPGRKRYGYTDGGDARSGDADDSTADD